jgi:hypothetical protein
MRARGSPPASSAARAAVSSVQPLATTTSERASDARPRLIEDGSQRRGDVGRLVVRHQPDRNAHLTAF